MPKAVGQEGKCQVGGKHVVDGHGDKACVPQKLRQAPVHLRVQVGIVHASLDIVDNGQVLLVHMMHQILEQAGTIGIGAGDIRGVTLKAGAGVDQH